LESGVGSAWESTCNLGPAPNGTRHGVNKLMDSRIFSRYQSINHLMITAFRLIIPILSLRGASDSSDPFPLLSRTSRLGLWKRLGHERCKPGARPQKRDIFHRHHLIRLSCEFPTRNPVLSSTSTSQGCKEEAEIKILLRDLAYRLSAVCGEETG
jgi:hypothetical protein